MGDWELNDSEGLSDSSLDLDLGSSGEADFSGELESSFDSPSLDGFEDLPFTEASDTNSDLLEDVPSLDEPVSIDGGTGEVEDLSDTGDPLDNSDYSVSETDSGSFSEMEDVPADESDQSGDDIKVLTLRPSKPLEAEETEEEYLDDMHSYLAGMGIPEGPEMDAIMQNEQNGWEEIHGGEVETEEIPEEVDIPEDTSELDDTLTEDQSETDDLNEPEETQEIDVDYDAIYGGMEQDEIDQGFEDIDINADQERLDDSLENFDQDNWDELTLEEQKGSMQDLANYVIDTIGFENPPQIEYYNNPREGDYGGYDASTNTLSVNEYMLGDSEEAADTIAHELWHAHQHECANNPHSARDYQYQYNFENYISPDLDHDAYEEQLIEAEARAFADQFKGRINELKGSGRSL